MDLPTCNLNKLRKVAELMASVRSCRVQKEKLALVLKQKGHIQRLLQLLRVFESFKHTEGLHVLFDIVRGILYLDEAVLFDFMFSDECVLDVVGCLEYDPSVAQPERHREFLMEIAKLQEFIPIRDPELRRKLRLVSVAQYVHSIILPNSSDSEEGFLSTLTSFIRSSKVELLSALQKDETFLAEVFAQLKDEATAEEQRWHLMKFFKEFCAFSLTRHTRSNEFLTTLVKLGLLPTLEKLMGMDNPQVRSAATDILTYLIHLSPSTVQEFVMEEARQSDKDTHLLIVAIEQMIYNPDPVLGGDKQLLEILCALIHPKHMRGKATKLEIREFLTFFYKRCLHVLTAPILYATSANSHEKDNYETAEIIASVLELLDFCVQRHKFYMRKYVRSRDLLRRVLVLMKSKHKFLALSALRFMRRIIGLKDNLYNQYIILGNLFEPVVDALLDNGTRSDMLSSAVLELFEFIRVENIQSLIAHIVENFSDKLESINYIHTFQELKAIYKQEELCQNQTPNSVSSLLPGKTLVRHGTVSKEDKKLQVGKVEKKAAPTPPESSKVSYPTCKTLTTVMTPVKRALCGFPGEDKDEKEVTPRKRAHLDG